MIHRSLIPFALLFAGACASVSSPSSDVVPAASQEESIVAFMDIGGVT